jgi:hypothetical protein
VSNPIVRIGTRHYRLMDREHSTHIKEVFEEAWGYEGPSLWLTQEVIDDLNAIWLIHKGLVDPQDVR